MRLGNYPQTPSERKRYAIDYSDWLDTSETLVTATFSVSPTTSTTFDIDAYAFNDDRTILIFYATGGEDGKTYTVTVTVTTSNGQTKQDTILFTVRDP